MAAWGLSWGLAWGSAWGAAAPPPPPPPVPAPVPNVIVVAGRVVAVTAVRSEGILAAVPTAEISGAVVQSVDISVSTTPNDVHFTARP